MRVRRMVAREVDSLKHAVRALKQGTASPVSVHAPCHPAHALHCTALHCTALHCTALHCTALHCTALHCTALQCNALHCMTRAVVSRAYHGYCLGLDMRVLDTPSQHASPVVMQSCIAWLCHWPCMCPLHTANPCRASDPLHPAGSLASRGRACAEVMFTRHGPSHWTALYLWVVSIHGQHVS
jgi:hypothetical protein